MPQETATGAESLNAADKIILRLVQADARVTIDMLAHRAGLSPSAAQRRLQRLRDRKVIIGETTIVDPRKVGRPLTFLVELELERDRPELLPALRSWLVGTEAVQQAWYVTGRGDFMLVVTAASLEEFDALMARLMDANRNVRKFTTSVALNTVKRGLCVPAA